MMANIPVRVRTFMEQRLGDFQTYHDRDRFDFGVRCTEFVMTPWLTRKPQFVLRERKSPTPGSEEDIAPDPYCLQFYYAKAEDEFTRWMDAKETKQPTDEYYLRWSSKQHTLSIHEEARNQIEYVGDRTSKHVCLLFCYNSVFRCGDIIVYSAPVFPETLRVVPLPEEMCSRRNVAYVNESDFPDGFGDLYLAVQGIDFDDVDRPPEQAVFRAAPSHHLVASRTIGLDPAQLRTLRVAPGNELMTRDFVSTNFRELASITLKVKRTEGHPPGGISPTALKSAIRETFFKQPFRAGQCIIICCGGYDVRLVVVAVECATARIPYAPLPRDFSQLLCEQTRIVLTGPGIAPEPARPAASRVD